MTQAMTQAMTSITWPAMLLGVGAISAILYGRKRQWLNAALVALAAVSLAAALAALVGLPLRQPLSPSHTDSGVLSIASGDADGEVSSAALQAIPGATRIVLRGDGWWDAQWRDLPARPTQWTPGSADLLWLDFPRVLTRGRLFTLTVRRAQASAGWRLQLLSENQQLLADSGPAADASAQRSVQWLAPVAEAMLLQARVLDAAGKVWAQGPIPLQVHEALPLQIQGRFDAASFDVRTLQQLLSDSGALLDWSVTLGKAVTRRELARTALTAPQALLVDAAYVEHLPPSARAALQASKLPLVILGANAADAALWQREFGLRLQRQAPTTEQDELRQFNVGGSVLTLAPAEWNPEQRPGAPWAVLARDNKQLPWLWQRAPQDGTQSAPMLWIGVADWHRYAISAPQALAQWWQAALDQSVLASVQPSAWQHGEAMPLPGLRSELCAQGLKSGTVVTLNGAIALPLQARSDKADAVCAAYWPQQSGWNHYTVEGMAQAGMRYVYARSDWPAWQRALRRDATALYVARATPAVSAGPDPGPGLQQPLPLAPLLLTCALAMLALWWREQRTG